MTSILISWIGQADLNAPQQNTSGGIGPIAQAVDFAQFQKVQLLSDYPKRQVKPFIKWLAARNLIPTQVAYYKLSSPTHFGDIYQAVIQEIRTLIDRFGSSTQFTYFLSPGTPAMAAVWILVAKTRYPGELIESSREKGVQKTLIPFDISADFLPDLIKQRDTELQRLTAGLPAETAEFSDIVHRSEEMKRVIALARRVSPRSVPVLIEGESGTGKELFARAIHKASPRHNKPFISINCGAIPNELIESELFGHEKGAFTGAIAAYQGVFESANEGTLFLDEIGELPQIAQVKLLRVIQESEIVRVGSVKPIKIHVRLIAATNRTLIDEIVQRRFREDLFYRLAVGVLFLPPLRERHGDLSLLIDHLLDQVNQESISEIGGEHKNISAGARNLLLQRRWPGNVRELLNTLRRAVVWSANSVINEDEMKAALLEPLPSQKNQDYVLNRPLNQPIDLPVIIKMVAQHYLDRALSETNGNKTEASKLLGLPSYQTLTNWLKKYEVRT